MKSAVLIAFGVMFMGIALECADENVAVVGLTLFCIGLAEGCEWAYNRIRK